ncbi:MAG: hypothetical protein M3R72_04035 [Bacteroidota bacterium]|nr:hypothetical protein [Bacteroidota bacterium]
MADLQVELEKLLTAYDKKCKHYNAYLAAAKEHSHKMVQLAETQPINITDFDEAEVLYDNMLLSEKTYRIHKEAFDRYREEVITKLAPVPNIKIKFSCGGDKSKTATHYFVWLKYNGEAPDEAQLVLQKISDTDNDPKIL